MVHMFWNGTEAVILVNVLDELLALILTQGLHVPWDALSYLSSCDGRLVNHLVQGSANTDEHLVWRRCCLWLFSFHSYRLFVVVCLAHNLTFVS